MNYAQMAKLVGKAKLPLGYVNQDGENVLIMQGSSDAGRFYRTDTTQNNGWTRINVYYEDGTATESYRK